MECLILEQIKLCETLVSLARTPSMRTHAHRALDAVYKQQNNSYVVSTEDIYNEEIDHSTLLESISIVHHLIEISVVQLIYTPDDVAIKYCISIFNDILQIYSPPNDTFLHVIVPIIACVIICFIGFELITFVAYGELFAIAENAGIVTTRIIQTVEPGLPTINELNAAGQGFVRVRSGVFPTLEQIQSIQGV